MPPEHRPRFSLRVLVALAAISVICLSCGEKVVLEIRMHALCKDDAGLKVYQTGLLPPSARRPDGSILLGAPMKLPDGWHFTRIGDDDFRLEWKDEILNDGNPYDHLYSDGKLLRNLQRLRRMADRAVVAESVSYTRVGGELTPFGMPSVSICPAKSLQILSAALPR